MSVYSEIPILTGFASWLIASCIIDSGAIRTGEVVSTTVMVWVAEAELPEKSVAVQITIVSPSGNTSGASLVTVGWESITSSDVGIPVSISTPNLSYISTWISFGATIDGVVVSITEICCESEAELPEESVAVQVTIVSPSGNTSGASLVMDMTSTSSDALTPIRSMILFSIWLASSWKSDGAIITGEIVSKTVIDWVFDIELP